MPQSTDCSAGWQESWERLRRCCSRPACHSGALLRKPASVPGFRCRTCSQADMTVMQGLAMAYTTATCNARPPPTVIASPLIISGQVHLQKGHLHNGNLPMKETVHRILRPVRYPDRTLPHLNHQGKRWRRLSLQDALLSAARSRLLITCSTEGVTALKLPEHWPLNECRALQQQLRLVCKAHPRSPSKCLL